MDHFNVLLLNFGSTLTLQTNLLSKNAWLYKNQIFFFTPFHSLTLLLAFKLIVNV